jgi:hypothetical protein
MSVHRMPPADEPFNPRAATLRHGGAAGVVAMNTSEELANVLAELANAIACGLVYVGDQIGAAVDRPTALQLVLPTSEAVAAWRALEPDPEPPLGYADSGRKTHDGQALYVATGNVERFSELKPRVRTEAERLLWDRHSLQPEHSAELIDTVLEVVGEVLNGRAGE